MADPFTIIGAVGAIGGILDVLTKAIRGISDLHDRWSLANLTILSLASQMSGLRAALYEIQSWMTEHLEDELHHQLIMDLDVSIRCCKVLISKINRLLPVLDEKPAERLDLNSSMKVVFAGKSVDDVQKMIGQQTTTLTLLLTACNSNTLAGQKAVLQTSGIQKNISRMKGDSASLIAHYDSSSIVSKMTDNLSKLSMVFGFDSKLFATNVYQRTLQTSYRQRLKWQRDAHDSNPTTKQIANSPVAPTRSSKITKHEIIVWDHLDRYGSGIDLRRLLLNSSEEVSRQGPKYKLWALLLLIKECKVVLKTAEHNAYYEQLERYFFQNRLHEPLPDLVDGAFLPLWNDPSIANKVHSDTFQQKHIVQLLLKQLECMDSNNEADYIRPWEETPTLHELYQVHSLPSGCGFDYPIHIRSPSDMFFGVPDRSGRNDRILIFSVDVMRVFEENGHYDVPYEYKIWVSDFPQLIAPVILLLVSPRQFDMPATKLDQIASRFKDATPWGCKLHVLRWSREQTQPSTEDLTAQTLGEEVYERV